MSAIKAMLEIRVANFHGERLIPVTGKWRIVNADLGDVEVEPDAASAKALWGALKCGVAGCFCGGGVAELEWHEGLTWRGYLCDSDIQALQAIEEVS